MTLRILITGASGFAGSHLAELLAKNAEYEVYGTYISQGSLKNLKGILGLRLEQIDLQDSTKVFDLLSRIKPDMIVHLAALASPSESYNNPKETIISNVSIEINILEAIRKLSLIQTKILIVSSAHIYGIVDQSNLPIDEDTPFRPENPYAVSKLTSDFLGLQYFLTHNLHIVRVRPFNHIGPRQGPHFVVPTFAKKIAEIEKDKAEPVIHVGNLETRRDFTDVRDMVRAYELALKMGEKGNVYNIGSGISYKMSEVLSKLLSMSSKSIIVKEDTSLLRPSDNPELVCDNSRFIKLTGWKPVIPIDQTLKETLDYWRGID